MTEIECPGFKEIVKYEEDGRYMIAHGWTESTGQSPMFPYTPPAGWEYDQRFEDISGSIGGHGGCPNCFMTMVHLKSTHPIDIITVNDPATPWMLIGIIIIVVMFLYKGE